MGHARVDTDGSLVTQTVEPVPGDYRLFYAGVRDALLGNGKPPVAGIDAWRTARVLEWALESSKSHRDVECDWSIEPAMSHVSRGFSSGCFLSPTAPRNETSFPVAVSSLASIPPPWAATIARAMARPMPVPLPLPVLFLPR